ncbi:hypothetical protein [Burkholderia glumae]|uniref:hypothetical protein n=1 Tax=Burkholderia TaxID=32008 RepID=UPI0021511577|nr:hypothetical protein [Burkholderia glumae]
MSLSGRRNEEAFNRLVHRIDRVSQQLLKKVHVQPLDPAPHADRWSEIHARRLANGIDKRGAIRQRRRLRTW